MIDEPIIQQARILKEHEEKYLLLQSQHYPNKQGGLYVGKFNNFGTVKTFGDEITIYGNIIENTGYVKKPIKQNFSDLEKQTKWEKTSLGSRGFPIHTPDTLFLLNSDNLSQDDLKFKLKSLTKEAKQLTVDDLIDQFPNVKQIWPIN